MNPDPLESNPEEELENFAVMPPVFLGDPEEREKEEQRFPQVIIDRRAPRWAADGERISDDDHEESSDDAQHLTEVSIGMLMNRTSVCA